VLLDQGLPHRPGSPRRVAVPLGRRDDRAGGLCTEIEALTGKPVLRTQTELVFDPDREVKVFFLAP
jgi:hypothetical protein